MRIKRSKEQDHLIDKLTDLYRFQYDGIITRIAYVLSLRTNKKFDDIDNAIGSDGKEFRDARSIFGNSQSGKSYYPIYKALLDQVYDRQTTEEEFTELFKQHLDHGLKLIDKNVSDLEIVKGEHMDYLVNQVEKSLKLTKSSDAPLVKNEIEKQDYPVYEGLVSFKIGTSSENEEVRILLNDLEQFDSHHMAIAGMTGAGKTQLIKDILYQISDNTNNELNYIFFDYKGEGDENQLSKLLDSTNAHFVDLIKDEFNFNPLDYISENDKREQNFQIQSFVDSIRAIEPKIGTKQAHILKSILTELFENGNKPELKDIHSKLENYYEEENISADLLLSVIENLSSGLFNKNDSDKKRIFDKSIYLNLPNTIADTIRQLCVFLILKYLLAEFSKSEDTSPTEGSTIKPLRYVIVIDEAHVYLKNKNARKILEDLLRVIRSKGVVIVLLTQGVEDFKRKDFDFSSQIKIPICLNIKDKNMKSLTNFLGTASSKVKFENAVSQLENGKGIINFREPKLIEVNQFYKTIEKNNL